MNCDNRFEKVSFDDIEVGFEFETSPRKVTQSDVEDFARLSGDYHPEHLNEEYARAGIYGERIAHGLLVMGIVTGQVNETGLFRWSTIGVLDMNLRFLKAVKFNDTISTVGRITYKRRTSIEDRGVVKIAIVASNQRSERVIEAEWALMVNTRSLK
jgi:acyl dehydratase